MNKKNPFALFTILLAGLCLICLSSCGKNQAETQQRLILQVTADKTSSARYTAESLNNQYSGNLDYIALASVEINMDNDTIPLEKAICENYITAEEIIAYAKIDARNGYCTENHSSIHGLTCFTYEYPSFKFEYINDIYETPDGAKHLIENIRILASSVTTDSRIFLTEQNDPNYLLDREDWGINFKTTQISPSEITIQCQQRNGQQFGTLQIYEINLYSHEQDLWISPHLPELPVKILMNADCELNFDWTNNLDSLPAGSYSLQLKIEDIYDEKTIHPLTENFHDRQNYILNFTIP